MAFEIENLIMIQLLDADLKKREDEITAHKSKVIRIPFLLFNLIINFLLIYSLYHFCCICQKFKLEQGNPLSAAWGARLENIVSLIPPHFYN